MANINGKNDWRTYVHESFFSLNVAFAIGYASLSYSFSQSLQYAASASGILLRYWFLRSAIRVNAFLHLDAGSRMGQEITFAVSVLAVALFLLSFLRMLAGMSIYRVLLNAVGGLTALLAVPACVLYGSKLASDTIPDWRGSGTFWKSPAGLLFAADILLVCIFLFWRRRQPLHTRTYIILVTFHYGWWASLLWLQPSLLRLTSPKLFVIVLTWSGSAWLFYMKRFRENTVQQASASRHWRFALSSALASIALILVLWLPAPGYSLAHPKNAKSLTITMVRGGAFCFRCPVYTVTIHGNGSVQYSGAHSVGIAGPQTTIIRSDQLTSLLQGFDRIRFFSLEDRAFEKCADGPMVSVSVLVDGKEKNLQSSASCGATASGPQAAFVGIAQEIDGIVGSDRWVRCSGNCVP